MHPRATVETTLRLAAQGIPDAEIARRLGVPRATIRDWRRGALPKSWREPGVDVHYAALPPVYAYLLGLYLGDGCLSEHPRDVYKLRVTLDRRYPGIIDECAAAMEQVRPASRVMRRLRPDNSVEVYAYSKAWPLLFPQHGSGPKHRRNVSLRPWQAELAGEGPELLMRGLIQSDGCRFMNTGRNWRCPRYMLTNRSPHIREIFTSLCDQLGVRWTSAPDVIYVSRKRDVAALDRFIGPKA